MSEAPQATKSQRAFVEQIKRIRAERGEAALKAMNEHTRSMNKEQQAVLAALAGEARSAPEVAEAAGLTPQRAFWWLVALRKYNKVQESGKRDGYTLYVRK